MTDTDDALAWHIARRTSRALATLHLSAFLAARRGHSVATCPFAGTGGIYEHEWRSAHAAGAQHPGEAIAMRLTTRDTTP